MAFLAYDVRAAKRLYSNLTVGLSTDWQSRWEQL